MTTTLRPKAPNARALLVLGVIVAAFLLFLPVRQLLHQRSQIDSLADRLDDLNAQNADLEREVGRLEDPDEIEVQARERLGLTQPDQQAYFLVPDESDDTEPAEPAEEPDTGNWFQRSWRGFVDLVRGRR